LNLVAAHAHGQAAPEAVDAVKPRIYALVAAVGAQFSVVSVVPTIGSHLSPYRRSTIEVPDNILNRFALHGLDRAIANIDPNSKRIYMTLHAAQMDGVEPSQRESVAIGKIVAQLEKMPQRLEWDRIVVATPAYRAQGFDGMASKLQGFGLFLQPLCQSDAAISCEYGFRPPSGPHALTPENKVIAANAFLAPFSYIEVWVLDPKTLAVLDKQQGFDNQKLADPTARMLDISQDANRQFLASRINSLIELSIDRAVKHTELSGKVEVGEPRVVKPDDDKK
jgi:hypothetical protein